MLLLELFSSIPRGNYHPALGITFPMFSFINLIGINPQTIESSILWFLKFFLHGIIVYTFFFGIACLYSTLCYSNFWIIFNCIKLHDYYTIISSLLDGHLKFYLTSHHFFFSCHNSKHRCTCLLVHIPWCMPRNGIAGLRVFSSPARLHTAGFCCRTTVPIYTPTSILMFLFPHVLTNPDVNKLLNFANLMSVICYFLTLICLSLLVSSPPFYMPNGYSGFLCSLPLHTVRPFSTGLSFLKDWFVEIH